MSEDEAKRDEQRGPRHPLVWVSTTYFAEGFPYALVNNVADAVFQALGASVQAIGLTALFHLPWNIKFLWAPPLDRYATKRAFIIGCEVAILAMVLVLALMGETPLLWWLSIMFVLVAFTSATHDIAIDGYYLEALDDSGRAKYVGFRAAAYRTAVASAAGGVLIVMGLAGFRVGWLIAAATVALLVVYHRWFLPRVERPQPPLRSWLTIKRGRVIAMVVAAALAVALLQWLTGVLSWLRRLVVDAIAPVPFFGSLSLEGWIALALLTTVVVVLALLGHIHRAMARRDSPYARAFVDLLAKPQMGRVLAFIILFRLGESFLMKMRTPFLLSPGPGAMSMEAYGIVNGTVGMIATLLATIVGGWLISRHGLRRWLWPFVLAQNIPNLLYAWAASQPDPSALGVLGLGAVVVGEDIGAGLGTAVFLVYIMRCVDPRHKATHMAVLTAIMSIGFTLAGVASGFLADALGFAWYFLLTFAATLPSMVLMPFVPHLDDPPTNPPKSAAKPGADP